MKSCISAEKRAADKRQFDWIKQASRGGRLDGCGTLNGKNLGQRRRLREAWMAMTRHLWQMSFKYHQP